MKLLCTIHSTALYFFLFWRLHFLVVSWCGSCTTLCNKFPPLCSCKKCVFIVDTCLTIIVRFSLFLTLLYFQQRYGNKEGKMEKLIYFCYIYAQQTRSLIPNTIKRNIVFRFRSILKEVNAAGNCEKNEITN